MEDPTSATAAAAPSAVLPTATLVKAVSRRQSTRAPGGASRSATGSRDRSALARDEI